MTTSELNHVLASAVQALGLEFVGAELANNGKQPVLRVFIDSGDGIKIADCEAASRQINSLLAVRLPAYKDYTLEVSSPGEDRRLFTLAHYQRFLGCQVRIKCRRLIEGRRTFLGCLHAATADEITVIDSDVAYVIPLNAISRANIVPAKTY